MIVGNKAVSPGVGIYVGYGASHSWTWFADIFDRAGYYEVSFLNEKDISERSLDFCDVFFVSGGDTFALAEGLGRNGAEQIERFVRNGGIYIGACAGAYLVLKSSIPPLNMFNFVHARIANLSKNLPAPKIKAEKFCTEYGCRYVFHPVREEVSVKLKRLGTGSNGSIKVPMYGGPVLLQSEDTEVLAEYESFTGKTEFLIDEDIARKTIIGNVAAAVKKLGKGMFYLFGPHFEHPDFTDANQVLFKILFESGKAAQRGNPGQILSASGCGTSFTKKMFRTFLSEISNARIAALALERTSYKWMIGKKVYDPEKIRVFLEAIWGRARHLESKEGYKYIPEHEMTALINLSKEITGYVRKLSGGSELFQQESKDATSLFLSLREAASKFLSIYFRIKFVHFS